ncbi:MULTISPECIES: hypothetical protein [Bacteria]
MDDRILEKIAAEFPLQSLTDQERQAEELPITRDPKPKRCRAWVRFGPHAMHVDAVVVAWTDDACGVEFQVRDRTLRCWVWRNAVTPV